VRTRRLLVGLLLLLTGCATPASRFGDPTLQRVRQGDEFTVTLTSDWEAGYGWRLARLPHNVRLIERRYLPPAAKGGEGRRGHEFWTLKAVAQGRLSLVWEYVPRHDPRATPVRTYIRQIEIP